MPKNTLSVLICISKIICMKKNIITFLLILCGQIVFSQINADSGKRVIAAKPTVIYQARIIPPSKAVLIRKDVMKLDQQLIQLLDSLTKAKNNIDNAKETAKNKLDSMSEMGEMESLRLQMAMDRLSKLMSTLSNLLKKASETASGITQNIK